MHNAYDFGRALAKKAANDIGKADMPAINTPTSVSSSSKPVYKGAFNTPQAKSLFEQSFPKVRKIGQNQYQSVTGSPLYRKGGKFYGQTQHGELEYDPMGGGFTAGPDIGGAIQRHLYDKPLQGIKDIGSATASGFQRGMTGDYSGGYAPGTQGIGEQFGHMAGGMVRGVGQVGRGLADVGTDIRKQLIDPVFKAPAEGFYRGLYGDTSGGYDPNLQGFGEQMGHMVGGMARGAQQVGSGLADVGRDIAGAARRGVSNIGANTMQGLRNVGDFLGFTDYEGEQERAVLANQAQAQQKIRDIRKQRDTDRQQGVSRNILQRATQDKSSPLYGQEIAQGPLSQQQMQMADQETKRYAAAQSKQRDAREQALLADIRSGKRDHLGNLREGHTEEGSALASFDSGNQTSETPATAAAAPAETTGESSDPAANTRLEKVKRQFFDQMKAKANRT